MTKGLMSPGTALYLDNNATAPLRPEAVAAMQQAMGPPSNPSSVHGFGRSARLIVEAAREEIALLVGSRAADIVFTSGGTESNNLALSGFDHIITSAIEHDSVLHAAPGADLVKVDRDGVIDLDHLADCLDAVPDAMRTKTLVSIMMANNETGVIQPIESVVAMARDAGVAVHSDMVQMLGKTHFDFANSGLDYATISAHKIGGPAGIGAFLVRPGSRLTSVLRGGGQEQGRRSGTENFLGVAGFGAAARAAFDDVGLYREMAGWRDAFEARMRATRDDIAIFGGRADRIGNTSCMAVGDKTSEIMVMALDIAGIAVSAGAACSSGKVHESHVLTAMQAGEGARRAVRISAGWQSKAADFERLAEVLSDL